MLSEPRDEIWDVLIILSKSFQFLSGLTRQLVANAGFLDLDLLSSENYVDSDGSNNESYDGVIIFLGDMLECFG